MNCSAFSQTFANLDTRMLICMQRIETRRSAAHHALGRPCLHLPRRKLPCRSPVICFEVCQLLSTAPPWLFAFSKYDGRQANRRLAYEASNAHEL
jgi:hypothetical protein